MIDWISCFVDVRHTKKMVGGYRMETDKHGELMYSLSKTLKIKGSWDASIEISSVDSTAERDNVTGDIVYTQVYISGNPTKYLQGHNIFGTNDFHHLMVAFFIELFKMAEISITDKELDFLERGYYRLTRIDCTDSLVFSSQKEVDMVLNRIAESGHYRHRGNATMDRGTIYFGKNSKKWSLKIYNKYKEVLKRKLPYTINKDKLLEFAKKLLRFEIVLRQQELKKQKLDFACNWNEKTVLEMIMKYINKNKLTISQNNYFSDNEILALPRAIRGTYITWLTGINVSATMSKATFYRHRTLLLEYGIDISTQAQKNNDNNVIQLVDSVDLDLRFYNLEVA